MRRSLSATLAAGSNLDVTLGFLTFEVTDVFDDRGLSWADFGALATGLDGSGIIASVTTSNDPNQFGHKTYFTEYVISFDSPVNTLVVDDSLLLRGTRTLTLLEGLPEWHRLAQRAAACSQPSLLF